MWCIIILNRLMNHNLLMEFETKATEKELQGGDNGSPPRGTTQLITHILFHTVVLFVRVVSNLCLLYPSLVLTRAQHKGSPTSSNSKE